MNEEGREMKVEALKAKYRRFRAWQENPIVYTNHNEHPVQCANCGTEFSGNFCPICGQKADVGIVDWTAIRQGVAMIWGMDSRSLSYTLFQLLLRPGYLISDYISGKRQVSFPPVKMLLILAVVSAIIIYFSGGDSAEATTEAVEQQDALEVFLDWGEENLGWGVMITSMLFLPPTMLLFRYAPKHPRHSLPQGFFIQVFMGCLLMILGILTTITGNENWMWLIGVYYLVAYHQLFGYGWWGSLWRTIICLFIGMVLFVSIGCVANLIAGFEDKGLIGYIVLVIVSIILVLVGHLINLRGKNRIPESSPKL